MPNETSPSHEQVAALKAQVFALVKACPAGRVTTYGWIGQILGSTV
jgi:methylated-DNA-protein-cysteine methyltransferase related protein